MNKKQILENSDTREAVAVMALLVPACKANGIARTTAWKLAKEGLLETVSIGRRRYVILASLRSLPARLGMNGGGQ